MQGNALLNAIGGVLMQRRRLSSYGIGRDQLRQGGGRGNGNDHFDELVGSVEFYVYQTPGRRVKGFDSLKLYAEGEGCELLYTADAPPELADYETLRITHRRVGADTRRRAQARPLVGPPQQLPAQLLQAAVSVASATGDLCKGEWLFALMRVESGLDHMSVPTLAERAIRRRIARRGPITFAEYMARALYGPGGYYTRNSAGTDYYTSPQVHPAFGALLAVQLFQFWRLLDAARPVLRDRTRRRSWTAGA